MFIMSYIGDQVWFMTSRQTEPDLCVSERSSGVVEDERCVQLIDVGVEYPVHEADAGALVRILIWQLHVNLPEATFEGCYESSA
jgi:hypothetical protein